MFSFFFGGSTEQASAATSNSHVGSVDDGEFVVVGASPQDPQLTTKTVSETPVASQLQQSTETPGEILQPRHEVDSAPLEALLPAGASTLLDTPAISQPQQSTETTGDILQPTHEVDTALLEASVSAEPSTSVEPPKLSRQRTLNHLTLAMTTGVIDTKMPTAPEVSSLKSVALQAIADTYGDNPAEQQQQPQSVDASTPESAEEDAAFMLHIATLFEAGLKASQEAVKKQQAIKPLVTAGPTMWSKVAAKPVERKKPSVRTVKHPSPRPTNPVPESTESSQSNQVRRRHGHGRRH